MAKGGVNQSTMLALVALGVGAYFLMSRTPVGTGSGTPVSIIVSQPAVALIVASYLAGTITRAQAKNQLVSMAGLSAVDADRVLYYLDNQQLTASTVFNDVNAMITALANLAHVFETTSGSDDPSTWGYYL